LQTFFAPFRVIQGNFGSKFRLLARNLMSFSSL